MRHQPTVFTPAHRAGDHPGGRVVGAATLALVALLTLIGGCGEPDLRPAGSFSADTHPNHQTGDPKNTSLEQMIIEHENNRPDNQPMLPIFMIGDGDYQMIEVPGNDAQAPTASDNARNVPVAFAIPASPESATGRPENLQRIAVGVLLLDDSQPQKIYRLADQTRVKLAGQVCRKAFHSFNRESGVKLPPELTLEDGYPAYFSAAYIYRDVDMIEEAPTQPQATQPADATAASREETVEPEAKPRRNVRIIRAGDIDAFLKANKADTLALIVLQIDDRNQNERLVALWLWSRDPVTHTLFKPSACVQATKIDLQWPEATDSEQVQLWHTLIALEKRLSDQKTVVIDRPRKTTP